MYRDYYFFSISKYLMGQTIYFILFFTESDNVFMKIPNLFSIIKEYLYIKERYSIYLYQFCYNNFMDVDLFPSSHHIFIVQKYDRETKTVEF